MTHAWCRLTAPTPRPRIRTLPTSAPDTGLGELRRAPAGLPDIDLRPPVVAESGDPFAAARVIDLVARLERGRSIRLAAIVDRLNATHLDWLFSERVVG